jgi:hypothetical protein
MILLLSATHPTQTLTGSRLSRPSAYTHYNFSSAMPQKTAQQQLYITRQMMTAVLHSFNLRSFMSVHDVSSIPEGQDE